MHDFTQDSFGFNHINNTISALTQSGSVPRLLDSDDEVTYLKQISYPHSPLCLFCRVTLLNQGHDLQGGRLKAPNFLLQGPRSFDAAG